LQAAAARDNTDWIDPDDHLNMCLGLGFGRVLKLTDDVFGDEVNLAYKLGEDLAVVAEILVTDLMHAALIASGESFVFGERRVVETGGVELGCRRLIG